MQTYYKRLEKKSLAGTEEYIVRGGRHLFPRLPQKLFTKIQQIESLVGHLMFGSAQNLRVPSRNPIKPKGLRENLLSLPQVAEGRFTKANNTLGEIVCMLNRCPFYRLISDAAQQQTISVF